MTKDKHDLIDILAQEEHELEDLLGELTTARDPGERHRILDDVTIGLVWHAVVEETHLFPAVRRHLPDGDRIADRYASDNAHVERLLEELRRSAAADQAFATLARRLVDEVEQHLREERRALLPRLAAHTRAAEDTPHRPRTPARPGACEENGMWPDLWAGHRCW
jgi:hemerythrin superfamily protein